MKSGRQSESIPAKFDELTSLRPLRPVRNEADLEKASEIADRLAVLARRNRDQEDYLQTLSLLIESFEQRFHEIDISDLDPVETLRSLLQSHGMSASDLGRILGNRSLGPTILRGERALSKSHILQLCEHFAVGPELFLKTHRRIRKAG